MKLFKCNNCSQPVYFENTFCGNCQSSLGFVAETLQLVSFTVEKNGTFRTHDKSYKTQYQYCANHQYNVCNWLVPVANGASVFCKACDLNRTIPTLNQAELAQRWSRIEVAKHRLAYALLRMKLPLVNKIKEPETGLAFDFVADIPSNDSERVLTGHDNGLITINIAEADDIEREMARKSMDEVYRTLLGHFRHEIGHYYWDRLISGTDWLPKFRALFGNEEEDYNEALTRHYSQGAPINWNQQYISAYASTHPWEDWAETWAHYMHIVDTLETAYSFGLNIETKLSSKFNTELKTDPYEVKDFDKLINYWLPLTLAMNSLNRSMGLNDIYPFIITPKVTEKLKFIHSVVTASRK